MQLLLHVGIRHLKHKLELSSSGAHTYTMQTCTPEEVFIMTLSLAHAYRVNLEMYTKIVGSSEQVLPNLVYVYVFYIST